MNTPTPTQKNTSTARIVRTLKKDRLALISFLIILLYTSVAITVWLGQIALQGQQHDYANISSFPSWKHPLGTDDEGRSRLGKVLALTGVHHLIAGYNQQRLELAKSNQPPSWNHLFGTDRLGRDVFKRTLVGTRVAMSVGLITSLIAIPIGIFFGAMAGYWGGKVDEIIVWIYSSLASVPDLLLILSLSLVLGKGLTAVYLAIGITTWVGLCRLIRGEFIKQRSMEYVTAARALGVGHIQIIFKHILPNVFHLVIINLSLRFVSAIQTEVILSYLGVGVQDEPSWGVMINTGKSELVGGNFWWEITAPAFAMFFIIYAFNIFGDALRNALDPKLSQ